MKRYAAILAYDGTDYQGFQRQPAPTPTIQAAVETALAAVTRGACAVVGAGRTDTGVHALGQVIAFDVDWNHSEDELLSAINSQLPAGHRPAAALAAGRTFIRALTPAGGNTPIALPP